MIRVKDIILATHDDIFPLLVWGEEGIVKPYEPKTYDNLEVHRIITEEENNQGLARHLLLFVKNKKENLIDLYKLVKSWSPTPEPIDSDSTSNISSIPPSCKNCPSHPSNGGSGICNCTLGQPSITSGYINTNIDAPEAHLTTTTTSATLTKG